MNLMNSIRTISIKLKKHEEFLEIISAVAVIVIMLGCFTFSSSYVSGEIETKLAIGGGMTFTNYSLLTFVLLSINGCGVVWLMYKYSKRSKLLISFISVLILSLAMAMSSIFLYFIPIVVCLIIFGVILKNEKRKERGGK